MTQSFKKSLTEAEIKELNEAEIKELKQEKILFKELYQYLASHEEFSEKIFDAMSHELRTPTVTIKAYTEMLLEGEFGDLTPKQKEKLERIKKNIDLLIDAIFDLLHARDKRAGL